ncbi:MAG: MarR family transcriptional regulator [Actinomycetota bacterium]
MSTTDDSTAPQLGVGAHLKANIATLKKLMDDLVADDMRALGLTTGEADVVSIGMITLDDPPAPTDLANWLSVTTAAIAQRLNSLEEKGLVERRRHPDDGRRLTVHLTDAGQQLGAQVLEKRNAAVADAIATGISEAEAQHIVKVTDRLVVALRQIVE